MRTHRGYTLAELVIVMVLVGILVAVALPRMFDMSHFSARGTRDFVGAALRYAQTSAVAMRRNVCIRITETQLDITHASAAGASQACDSGNLLNNPGNGRPYRDPSNSLSERSPVGTPTSLIFDALGRPLLAPGIPRTTPLSLTITGHATPLVIEPETGLVR